MCVKGEILKLSWEATELGCLLGSGNFASVYVVSLPGYHKGGKADTLLVKRGSKQSSRSPKSNSSHGHPSLALKCLPDSAGRKESDIELAADCLLIEIDILSKLPRHPNIIRLYAVSSNLTDNPRNAFLLLQRVPTTLTDLLLRWKNAKGKISWKSLTNRAKRQERLLQEQQHRVNLVAPGLVRALSFLHRHHILYRDLKPANVGLDDQGQVRLFDFGASRRILYHKNERQLTKLVGSARYMAPEMIQGQGAYSFSADVYSFGILLWQVATLSKPFQQVQSKDQMKQLVLVKHERPSLRAVMACDELRDLLQACWHPQPDARPTFATIAKNLEMIHRNSLP